MLMESDKTIDSSLTSTVDLLHPELLSDEMLLQIFNERCFKIKGIEQLGREKLLEMFRQYCLPQPQRKRDRPNSAETKKRQNNNSNQFSNDFKRIKLSCGYTEPVDSKRKHESPKEAERVLKKSKNTITWP